MLSATTAVAKVFFLKVGPPKESIFSTTFYGLYFSTYNTQTLQITFLHDIDILWAAFQIRIQIRTIQLLILADTKSTPC